MLSTSGYRVITIAFEDGARAEAIGRRVATDLEFRYVDDQIIERAAEIAGVTASEVAEVEHSRSLVVRILTALATVAMQDAAVGMVALVEPDRSPEYRALIQEAIRRTADDGSVVIGAHGAGILLAGRPDTVRVLLTGSAPVRARCVAEEHGIAECEAQQAVARADRERAAYLQRFYHVREELPTHYDLVLNTDVLTPEQAARIIRCAAA